MTDDPSDDYGEVEDEDGGPKIEASSELEDALREATESMEARQEAEASGGQAGSETP